MSKIVNIQPIQAHTVKVYSRIILDKIEALLSASNKDGEVIVDMVIMDGNHELKKDLLSILGESEESNISEVINKHSYIVFYS